MEKRQTALEQQFKSGLEGKTPLCQKETITNTVDGQEKADTTLNPLEEWKRECLNLALLLRVPRNALIENYGILEEVVMAVDMLREDCYNKKAKGFLGKATMQEIASMGAAMSGNMCAGPGCPVSLAALGCQNRKGSHMMGQEVACAHEDIADAEKVCQLIKSIPEPRRQLYVLSMMAYMDGVEAGMALERDGKAERGTVLSVGLMLIKGTMAGVSTRHA